MEDESIVFALFTSDDYLGKMSIVENGQGRGLFTHVILKGLQGSADIIQRDGYINIEELQSYVRTEVPRLSHKHWKYEQFPQSQLSGKDFPISQVSQ